MPQGAEVRALKNLCQLKHRQLPLMDHSDPQCSRIDVVPPYRIASVRLQRGSLGSEDRQWGLGASHLRGSVTSINSRGMRMLEVTSKGSVMECLMQVLCMLFPEFFLCFACLCLCPNQSLCLGCVLIKRRKVSRSQVCKLIGVGEIIEDLFESQRGALCSVGLGMGL